MDENPPPLPLSYSNLPPPRLTSIPWTIALSVGVVLILYVVFFLAPQFDQTFRSMRTQVPFATKLFLEIATAMKRYFLWVLLLPVPAVVPMLAVRLVGDRQTREPSGRSVTRSIGLTLWVVLVVAIPTAFCLFWPMIVLIQSVSGSGGQR